MASRPSEESTGAQKRVRIAVGVLAWFFLYFIFAAELLA